MTDAVTRAWGDGRAAGPPRRGARAVLSHLAGFPGQTWQGRWEASGLNAAGRRVGDVAGPPTGRAGRREVMTAGLRALLCVRAFRPTLAALRSNRILRLAETFRLVEGDELLDQFFEEVASSGRSATVRTAAVLDVTYALLSQGIGLRDLTPEALLHYAFESGRLGVTPRAVGNANRLAGAAAWDVLHRMGHFGPGAPHSLKVCLNGGQRSAAELVDRHDVSNADIREVLIEYLERRRPECDYSTWAALSLRLVGQFWKQIELIDASQKDLRLPSSTYEQWAAGLRIRSDGRARLRPESIVATVRSFYLDLQSWAVEEPERWAQWAAPCPVPPGTGRSSRAGQRRVTERVADRIRQRQPWLPTLVEHVERQHARLRELLGVAGEIPAGAEFTYAGCVYQRTDTEHDRQMVARGQIHVRVKETSSPGELTNLTLAEDAAFWTWACVETLRHTGLRIEELLELSQLSIRQYERPNGELIGLLVIAPSKTDRERVIPMSAELFHVIAAVIGRHTTAGRSIRVVRRWDPHERVWSAPMPFLFQRPLISAGAMSLQSVREAITRQCEQIAAAKPAFASVRFTPHDFRRLFATELVNNGLPIHIGAKLLGHLDLATTQGYVAVFEEDTVRHYQDFLARRRALRPADEYGPVDANEWSEFEDHFDKRKVELGNCDRPYGSPCQHEHACLRCPLLRIKPAMLPRLAELETDLQTRRDRASAEGWLGEIEGIDLTLRLLREKQASAERINADSGARSVVDLGMPSTAARSTLTGIV
ncbi:tyrosine-type recombinase/integrase [Kribbella sp. NPDC000426]|uniref:tyrosine-type recombinase/integrase n=1 Tax=Kribbella sp. NPDC000426 TaxID=3154255 RepID=UPI003329DE5F